MFHLFDVLAKQNVPISQSFSQLRIKYNLLLIISLTIIMM